VLAIEVVKNSIRIVVANPNPLFRLGIICFLRKHAGLRVVGEASNGNELLAEAKRLKPDLVLMEVDMDGIDGLEAIRSIRSIVPMTRVVILTASQEHMVDAINSGVQGYLPKGIDPKVLVDTIKAVCRGEIHLAGRDDTHHVSVSGLPLTKTRYLSRQRGDNPLSRRQREVLAYLSRGLSDRKIAGSLGITENTVRNHVKGILARLQLENRSQAVAFVLQNVAKEKQG